MLRQAQMQKAVPSLDAQSCFLQMIYSFLQISIHFSVEKDLGLYTIQVSNGLRS